MGLVKPHKVRNCNKCTKDILIENCDKLEQEPPNQFGHMLPSVLLKKINACKSKRKI